MNTRVGQASLSVTIPPSLQIAGLLPLLLPPLPPAPMVAKLLEGGRVTGTADPSVIRSLLTYPCSSRYILPTFPVHGQVRYNVDHKGGRVVQASRCVCFVLWICGVKKKREAPRKALRAHTRTVRTVLQHSPLLVFQSCLFSRAIIPVPAPQSISSGGRKAPGSCRHADQRRFD